MFISKGHIDIPTGSDVLIICKFNICQFDPTTNIEVTVQLDFLSRERSTNFCSTNQVPDRLPRELSTSFLNIQVSRHIFNLAVSTHFFTNECCHILHSQVSGYLVDLDWAFCFLYRKISPNFFNNCRIDIT